VFRDRNRLVNQIFTSAHPKKIDKEAAEPRFATFKSDCTTLARLESLFGCRSTAALCTARNLFLGPWLILGGAVEWFVVLPPPIVRSRASSRVLPRLAVTLLNQTRLALFCTLCTGVGGPPGGPVKNSTACLTTRSQQQATALEHHAFRCFRFTRGTNFGSLIH
jgi:hypothetical protein